MGTLPQVYRVGFEPTSPLLDYLISSLMGQWLFSDF